MKFLIYSPGRTGSSIIRDALPVIGTGNATHNPVYIPDDPENTIAIVSRRRDEFALAMSKIISDVTCEFTAYTKKEIAPFTVSDDLFVSHWRFNRLFYLGLDLSKFEQTLEIYLEDMLTDPKYLFSLFGIDKAMLQTPVGKLANQAHYSINKPIYYSVKSLYAYQNIITNWQNLYQLYLTLQDIEFTDKEIQLFKNDKKNIQQYN